MAQINYETLSATATSSGTITTYSAGTYNGYLQAIRYVAAQTSTVLGISSGGGSSLSITAERTGATLLTLADASSASQATYYPRALLFDTAGASTSVGALIPLVDERLLVAITSGSTTQDTKQATLYIYVD